MFSKIVRISIRAKMKYLDFLDNVENLNFRAEIEYLNFRAKISNLTAAAKALIPDMLACADVTVVLLIICPLDPTTLIC